MTVFSLEQNTRCVFHLKLSQYVMKPGWNYIQFNWKKVGTHSLCQIRFEALGKFLRCDEGRAVLTVECDFS